MSLRLEYTGGIPSLAHSQIPVVCLDMCKQGKLLSERSIKGLFSQFYKEIIKVVCIE